MEDITKELKSADKALETFRERRFDRLLGRMRMSEDSEYLLYSIANSLLALANIEKRRVTNEETVI